MRGRPKKEINKKIFENLCAVQCTEAEICSVLEVTDKTLNRWCKREYGATFSEVFAEKRGVGRASLRRYQFQQAEKNPTMAIWLGKQYLGQKDQQNITVAADADESIKEMDEYFKQKTGV